MYNNKNPFGYGSRMNINGIRPFEEELIRGIFDIVNPFRGWKPKETPYWKAILQNQENGRKLFNSSGLTNGGAAEFRDMIYRQALGLPQNKNGTVFVENGDGTLGVDISKRNAINRQYGGKDHDDSFLWVTDETKTKVSDVPDYGETFLSGDNLVGVGGHTEGVMITLQVAGVKPALKKGGLIK